MSTSTTSIRRPPPPPCLPPPSTSLPPTPTQSRRNPLESSKSIISVEQFQRRHVEEFAHLHTDSDNSLLAIEKARLEEERRKGRERRQSRQTQQSGRSVSVDETPRGTRPLSLIRKRDHGSGHNRSKTMDGLGLGIDMAKGNSRPSLSLRPLTLRSSIVSPTWSSAAHDSDSGNSLEVLVEREGSPIPESGSSEGNTSISTNQSTYSWATSFSGETSELRTAAHYVPPPSTDSAETPEVDESQLDSPARTVQRRKRIVAIAHTVRQLEGVGSRDLEDPNFYHILQKAWYARFDEKDRPPPQQQQQPPVSDLQESPPLLPPTPYNPTTEYTSSPPDLEFQTPDNDFQPTFNSTAHQYPRPDSVKTYGSSMRSNSVRYSYASTLHDLALDGGYAQGSRLMREKPWMRPTSSVGTPWGGDFMAPPAFRSVTPEEDEPEEEDEQAERTSVLESPFNYGPPPLKGLRRAGGNVARATPEPSNDGLDKEDKLPRQGEAGPSKWGIGFPNAWWGNAPSTRSTTPAPVEVTHTTLHQSLTADVHSAETVEGDSMESLDIDGQDFQLGENSNIPRTQNGSQIHHRQPMMTSRTSLAVLEPGNHNIRSRPRVNPLRRHSLPELASPDTAKATLTRRSDPIESVFWNRYRPIYTLTHSTTSSDNLQISQVHPVERQQPQMPEGAEDGLTGSEKLLRLSTTMSAINQQNLPLGKTPSHYHPSQSLVNMTPPGDSDEQMEQWEAGVIPPLGPLTTVSPPLDLHRVSSTPFIETIESVQQAQLQLPQPVIPIRSTSRHHDYVNSSYPPWSNGIASVALPPHPDQVQDQGYQYVRGGHQLGTASSQRDHVSSPPDDHVGMQIAQEKPISRPLPKLMFILGFIMPLLWIFGGWSTGSGNAMTDVERGVAVSTRAAETTEAVEKQRWWRRWAYHPDPYVERCRWAAGVTVPLCVAGGVTAAIVLGVMG